MGLFSKKSLVCTRCGKTYEARIVGEQICPECLVEIDKKEKSVSGYRKYAETMGWGRYTEAQIDEIIARRDKILMQSQLLPKITKEELKEVARNYQSLTVGQKEDIVSRIGNTTIDAGFGAASTQKFFIPTYFERTIVDASDVFAVAMVDSLRGSGIGRQGMNCAILTNDPYFPVVFQAYTLKLKLFHISSKEGEAGLRNYYEMLCPNLTYSVMKFSALEKQIKADGRVKGNMSPELISRISTQASLNKGVFEAKKEPVEYDETLKMLRSYGFIPTEEILPIIRKTDILQRK